MYLKTIRAHGFKSFADKINLELEKGITAIVGPNGSGKSNVVDAVRWVLGEQSVKSLRGDGNMVDVIFSGSKSRNSQNVASVTLVFDNSDHYLPLDYNEISIKRRVYRDGTNEYFLNKEKCRLKDITDLLLDSGVAKESFNIISQGKIEEIISSKPTDRRVIIEEAASVLKYKKRKEEALRKLEKTHENMNRVEDIIKELEVQVEPLRIQKETLEKYLEFKSELQQLEISLITNDITNINFKFNENKKRIETLTNEILNMNTSNSKNEVELEKLKLSLNDINKQIDDIQKDLLEATTNVEKINSQKQIVLERKKYEVEDSKIHQNIVLLKETELKLSNEINNLENNLKLESNKLDKINTDINEKTKKINELNKKRIELDSNLSIKIRSNKNISIEIDKLTNIIENNTFLPSSVKNIISNIKLKGIHSTISQVIETDEAYSKAISTAIGASANFIITDDETSAREAINYLKQNNMGRATFFPINVIKKKFIDNETLNKVTNLKGFIGIASNLVKTQKIYEDIIQNQLGNVIICDNLENASIIAKQINHKNKIVTLSGDVVHVGGSLTGGALVKQKNIISQKYELEELLKKEQSITSEIKTVENKINELDYNIRNLEDELYILKRNYVEQNEIVNYINQNIKTKKTELESAKLELMGTENLMSNKLQNEEEDIMKKYYDALKNKDNLESKLKEFTNKRNEKTEEIEEMEFSIKRENSLYNSKNKELKQLEIEVNRQDVKLDTLLNELSNYSITYEKSKEIYKLEIDETTARNKISSLKNNINSLGPINESAKEEYEKVSTRYEFLLSQKNDLEKARNTLLEIIDEMDNVMKKEFINTFEIIKQKFSETFKELFRGGDATLKLTDPSNILETGIEIVASPPGKKLTSISLLSGGEKTFTAISLLFAILKTRSVPFCILDEVEAALDDVNVDSFGKYLEKLQNKTQFILITHKKKTMEYAKVLYGITMQESGVSKLVSVKLEEIEVK
ncbi:MAG: AAA family ATPase [Bacilli bacterium]|nr:AAA family ATPase [Bacilli bacterium]